MDGGGDEEFGLRLCQAIEDGESVEEVRRVIDDYAHGDAERRRSALVNVFVPDYGPPLVVAHKDRRGDLVGMLLEEGADVKCDEIKASGLYTTAIALCISYGQVESLRALLRGGHSAN
jgi:hypothetical protein